MGRMTYITSCAPEWVKACAPHLEVLQLKQIRDEVQSEIDIAEKNGRYLGMAMDHSEWVKVVNILNKEINERTNNESNM